MTTQSGCAGVGVEFGIELGVELTVAAEFELAGAGTAWPCAAALHTLSESSTVNGKNAGKNAEGDAGESAAGRKALRWVGIMRR